MRILTIISGILMVLSGVFCFVNPGQTFLALAFIIGIVMVINGIIHTMAYLIGRGFHNRGDNNGWILTDALITLLLGILVLCNQLVADTVIPMVFGMWILVSGILRIEAATRIDRVRKRANFMTNAAYRDPYGDNRHIRIHKSAGDAPEHHSAPGDIPCYGGREYH